MFGRDQKDLAATLTEMHRTALWRTNSNQPAAKELFREYLADDKRFGGYDAERLIDAVSRCRRSLRSARPVFVPLSF
jgi:hypothetical protein